MGGQCHKIQEIIVSTATSNTIQIKQRKSLPSTLLKIKQLALDSKNCPYLYLKATSPYCEQPLKITPQGLSGSQRNRRDGQVYFGNKCKQTDISLWGNRQGILFKIAYDPIKKNYNLTDLTKTVYLKKRVVALYPQLKLKIGASVIEVGQQINQLQLLFTEGSQKGSHRWIQEGISIGRDKDCSIILKDQTVSKFHAKVQKRIDWMMIDFSRNGLWVQSNKISIKNGMCFVCGDWKFQCQVVQRD